MKMTFRYSYILFIISICLAGDYYSRFTITSYNDRRAIIGAYYPDKPDQFVNAKASSIYEIEVAKTTGPDPSNYDIYYFRSLNQADNQIFIADGSMRNPDPEDRLVWIRFNGNDDVKRVLREYYDSNRKKLIDPLDIAINPSSIVLNDSVRIFYNEQNQLHLSGDENILKYLKSIQNRYIKLSLFETDSIWQLTPDVNEGDTTQETMSLSIPVYTSLYYKDSEVIDEFTPIVKTHPKYFDYTMIASSTTQPIVTEYLPAFDVSAKDTIWLEYIAEDGKRISGPIYVHGCFEEREIITELGNREKHYVPCDMVDSENQLVTIPPTYIRDKLTDVDSKRNYPVWIPKILKERLNIETEQKVHPLLKYIPLGLGSIIIILLSV